MAGIHLSFSCKSRPHYPTAMIGFSDHKPIKKKAVQRMRMATMTAEGMVLERSISNPSVPYSPYPIRDGIRYQ